MPYAWDNPIEIRDVRNGDWFWVEKYVWKDKRLTSSDKVIYGTLAFFANQVDQLAFPSLNKISEESRLSRAQIVLSIKKLKKLGYIGIDKTKGKVNKYQLLKNKRKKEVVQNLDQSNKYTNQSKIWPGVVQNMATNNTLYKELNNNILVAKATNSKAVYGNPDINEFMDYFKKELNLGILDGSIKQNRNYANLVVKKCGGLNIAKKVIKLAAVDDFYKDKIASVKTLYYRMAEIVQKAKNRKVTGVEL